MRRLSAARREPGIEITPLIDVVFLLLIFFMVSANFVQKQAIAVALPEAGASIASAVETLEITVQESGRYWVDDILIGTQREDLLATLRASVSGLSAEQLANQPVEIRADAMAAHQAVIRALDVCATLGLVRVSLATIPTAPEEQR